jgi:phenazine biosynthesis protein phzE
MTNRMLSATPSSVLGQLTDPAIPAFALLYRPQLGGRGLIDVLVGHTRTVDRLSTLPIPESTGPAGLPRQDLLAIIPYRQIWERGFACRDDGAPLVVLTVTEQHQITVTDAMRTLPDIPVVLTNAGFDVNDAAYADIVRRVLADEIGQGAGSNFVIKRSYMASIENFSRATALTVFRRLLDIELGSYWTFIVHTGTRTLVGATPERHISLINEIATMNPISGTYRYPPAGPGLTGLLEFLADRKETEELYMVVDEELKMMARVCERGGRVVGPFLKEMARLAHTEYFIEGHGILDVREILRETMFAPPVIGSPLENAFRVITRYETSGRGYYSGILALIGRDAAGARTLDSAIVIRSADIDPAGRLKIDVGATLVRHSDPDSEVAETMSKAAGLLGALSPDPVKDPPSAISSDRGAQAISHPRLGTHPAIRHALARRNETLARFWLSSGFIADHRVLGLAGHRVLIIDAEDSFTAMLAHQLRSLGLNVMIRNFHDVIGTENSDLVVVGPGPGNPLDRDDDKISRLRATTEDLLRQRRPFLGLCLGHQVLADALGLTLQRKDVTNQGIQRVISLFGHAQRVGFYNTFAAFSNQDNAECVGVGKVMICRDGQTGEVHAIRGPQFSSFQFHPESVLTEHGITILADEVTALLDSTCRLTHRSG